jgi:CRISPR-associated protein Csb2
MNHILLTVRFLDGRYHGLLERGGPPEWPPSPFRLFQALVAGVARRGDLVIGDDVPSNTNFTPIGKAIDWLQRYTRDYPPIILAPKSRTGRGITRFVPNNDGDRVFDRQERLAAKPTIPTLFILENDQKPEVHYTWEIARESDCPIDDIRRAARSLTTLGWGIDMAFADARLADDAELQMLRGVRWYPKKRDWPFRDTLRMPTFSDDSDMCTLCDLRQCHNTSINRIEDCKPLKTVARPTVFDRVLYVSSERHVSRPYVVFKLLDENEDTVAYPHAKLIHLSGMVRHAAIELMPRNPPRDLRGYSAGEWAERYVAGHGQRGDESDGRSHMQFSYVPLPSIGYAHTDPRVRRVMIVAPMGDEDWLEHLAQYLDGQTLVPLAGTMLPPGTHLERIPVQRRDGVRDAYTCPSHSWASFTPIILPGHGDHKPDKTRRLILKALAQSGIEQPCEFEWSAFSQFPKSFSAYKYDKQKRLAGYVRPDHLMTQSTVHLTLKFNEGVEIPGPLVIGAGRHCGFGLMAAVDDGV